MTKPFFSDTVAAMLAGREVRQARLVYLDLTSGPRRLFEGFGQVRTADGSTWDGLGEIGSISDIESDFNGQASQVTFTLSGVDVSLISAALDASEEVKGRECVVYQQFFDEEWQTLDSPYTVFKGVMDVMKISAPSPLVRTINLTAEGMFTARGFAPFAFVSDRDQKRMHPGDRGAERIAQMAGKYVLWPTYQ